MTSPDEYRKLTTKEVALPSGAVFTIRKFPPQAILRLFGILDQEGLSGGAGKPEDFGKAMLKHYNEINEAVLPAFVVKPKLSMRKEEGSLEVEELSWDDSLELLMRGFDFTGLTEKGERERDSFREPVGAATPQPSGDLQPEAEQLPK